MSQKNALKDEITRVVAATAAATTTAIRTSSSTTTATTKKSHSCHSSNLLIFAYQVPRPHCPQRGAVDDEQVHVGIGDLLGGKLCQVPAVADHGGVEVARAARLLTAVEVEVEAAAGLFGGGQEEVVHGAGRRVGVGSCCFSNNSDSRFHK